MFELADLKKFDNGKLNFAGWHGDDGRMKPEVQRAVQGIKGKMKTPYKVESRALMSRRIDNEFNNEAIEVLLPLEYGGPDSSRHIGYLFERDLWKYRDSLNRLLDVFFYIEVKLVHVFSRYGQKQISHYNDFLSDYELRKKWAESPISEKRCIEIGAEYMSSYIALPSGEELALVVEEVFSETAENHDLGKVRNQCHALRIQRAIEDPRSPANERLRQHSSVADSIAEYWLGRNSEPINPESITFVPVHNSRHSKIRVKSGRSEIGMVSNENVLCLKDERMRLSIAEAADRQRIDLKIPLCDIRVPQYADVRIAAEGGGLYEIFAVVDSSRSEIRLIGDYNSKIQHLRLASLTYESWVIEVLARHGLKVMSVDVSFDFPNSVTKIKTYASQEQNDSWNSFRVVGVAPLALRAFIDYEQKRLGLYSAADSGNPQDQRQLEMFSDSDALKIDEWAYRRFQDLFLRIPDGQDLCRICSNPALSIGELSYCMLCCTRASRGIWLDDGLEGRNTQRAVFALSTLITEEFSNRLPSRKDLSAITATNPKIVDRQMLLRFMIPRNGLITDTGNAWRGWDEWLRLAGAPTNRMTESKNNFGNFGLAVDGHTCRSDFERRIDNFLHLNGISHTVEPLYPFDEALNSTGLRGDWLIANSVFVEAWGLIGQEHYDQKINRKRELARKHGIRVIEIVPADLPNLNRIFSDFIDH